jgi:hypothetical protein
MKSLLTLNFFLVFLFTEKPFQKRLKQDFDVQKITWNDLKDVHFKKKFNIDLAMFYLYPNFDQR